MKLISLAIEASLLAGKEIMRIYDTQFSHDLKEDKEPVTEADLASDKIIQRELSKSEFPVLSEESADHSDRLNQDKVWIIDPLDGTSDFVNKTGQFSVMIALVENHVPVLGVIYRPVTNEMYIAELGKGAFKRNKDKWEKLYVGNQKDIIKIRTFLSRHHLSEEEKSFLKVLGLSEFIQMGSAGLKIVSIAENKADLYFTMTDKIKQWDTAAGYCIIKEAGGKITDMNGDDLLYNTKDVYHKNGILVTNSLIHERIVKEYNSL